MKNGWQVEPLGIICTVVNRRPYAFTGARPYFSTGAVGPEGSLSEPDLVMFSTKPSRAGCMPLTGDVGFARMKGTKKVILIDKLLNESLFSTGFCFLEPKPIVDPRFIYYFVISDIFQNTKNKNAGEGIMGGIKNSDVECIKIPFPALPEQKKIVTILDKAFEEIIAASNIAEQNLFNSRELFESTLESIFTSKGDSWTECKLGELATFRNGINFTKTSKGDTVKILGVKDFQNYFLARLDNLDTVITDGALPDSDMLKENDILFVRSNGNLELIGRCLLVGAVTTRITFSGFTIRARLNDDSLVARYLCHFLKSKSTRRKMIDGGNGANIKSLNQTTLSELTIPFPAFVEQTRIVNKLDELSIETKKLETIYQQKLFALNELKKSILNQAFSGKL